MTRTMPENLERLIEFHGHICPGLVMGYLATKLALEKLGIESAKDEELIAIIETNACGLDAVQFMASCTMGKGNLFVKDYGKQVFTFARRPSGEAIRIVLNSKKIDQQLKDENLSREERIDFLLKSKPEDIFDFTLTTVDLPPEAKIYSTLICQECGEGVMEARARIKNDKVVCIPCFEKNDSAT